MKETNIPIYKNNKKISRVIFAIVIFSGILLLSYSGYFFYKKQFSHSADISLPSLANIEFPSEKIQYPEGWPEELKFPTEFILVDGSSGKVPEGLTKGWTLKLRYGGKPSEAEDVIVALFENKGWAIVKNYPLESGGFSLLMQRDQDNGIVVIDKDPNVSAKSIIIATFFL